MNVLQDWLSKATPAEKARLCRLAGTTPGSLHQMSKAYKTNGDLRISADMARRLEHGTRALAKETGLPVLHRRDLSPACEACEYARRACD